MQAIYHALRGFEGGAAQLTCAYFDKFDAAPILVRAGPDLAFNMTEGLIQGDPASPLLFALALQPALRRAQSELEGYQSTQQAKDVSVNAATERARKKKTGRLFAYLDDLVLVGPVAAVFLAFKTLRAAWSDANLQLNPEKCSVLCPAALYSPGTTEAARAGLHADLLLANSELQLVITELIPFLNTPFGRPDLGFVTVYSNSH
eukprot:m.932541 g.932541  ORF g.932541 m.932541 type:complete len:204 (-) comp190777_c0_seq1:30-641(-)